MKFDYFLIWSIEDQMEILLVIHISTILYVRSKQITKHLMGICLTCTFFERIDHSLI